jgi:hypothetical protein
VDFHGLGRSDRPCDLQGNGRIRAADALNS